MEFNAIQGLYRTILATSLTGSVFSFVLAVFSFADEKYLRGTLFSGICIFLMFILSSLVM